MGEKLRKQFEQMKAKHPDAVLLFRVGDFYESYEEDAEIVAKELGITITKKGNTKMTGFPQHSLDNYLPKLVRAGKRVAMCDQLEDPKLTKKLVKRGITEDQSSSTPQVKHFNSPKTMEVKNIPLSDIQPSPLNPRKTFDEEGIHDLADNIRQNGLLQPITIRPVEGKDTPYEIVCGERRYRAFILNQKIRVQVPSDIPCIVRDMTDEEALDAMITENLQRQDVDPIEEAFAFEQLKNRGSTVEEIALRFGKSTRFIADRIKLNNLIPELLIRVKDGSMAISAGLMISKLEEDDQRKFQERYSTWDKIGKENAVRYCNEVFQFIGNSPWYQDDRVDFDGGCGVKCSQCQFNNINAGCLFYEMKAEKSTAKCTNKAKFQEKKFAYMMSLIDVHADRIVKIGESMEQGKIALVSDISSYCINKASTDNFLEQCKSKGYEVFKCDDVFERYSSYDEDDERLQEKLANHEVYHCICISNWYDSIEVKERFYEFKKNMEGVDNATIQEGATVAKLTQKYKDICSKCRDKCNLEVAGLFTFSNSEISNDDLTEEENDAVFMYLLASTSWEFRRDVMKKSHRLPLEEYYEYVVSHPDERNKILREWLRCNLNRVDDLGRCSGQYVVANQWYPTELAEIMDKFNTDLEKKTSKIVKQLDELGYTTDGKKK